MNKNHTKNYSIATEVIMEANRRTRFWFRAFLLSLAVTAGREVVRIVKGGAK